MKIDLHQTDQMAGTQIMVFLKIVTQHDLEDNKKGAS